MARYELTVDQELVHALFREIRDRRGCWRRRRTRSSPTRCCPSHIGYGVQSTSPPAQLNAKLKRRSKVVGVFPNPASVERLLGTALMEIDQDRLAAER